MTLVYVKLEKQNKTKPSTWPNTELWIYLKLHEIIFVTWLHDSQAWTSSVIACYFVKVFACLQWLACWVWQLQALVPDGNVNTTQRSPQRGSESILEPNTSDDGPGTQFHVLTWNQFRELFYNNITRKVINQGAFQIHRWEHQRDPLQ